MGDQRHSRRDFLRGKAVVSEAADAVASAIDRVADAAGRAVDRRLQGAESPEEARNGVGVLTLSRRAMACEFQLRLPTASDRDHTEAGMAALDLVERLEDQLTVYRERSELIDLNRLAAKGPVAVEPRLFALLQLADSLHTATDGAFDPTSGPLSRVWGFHRREGRMPSEEEVAAARGLVGWDHVRLDPSNHTVTFDTPGVELNVNSIGKGYALDRAGELLDGREAPDWLIHGGRSTLLARGDHPLRDRGGWGAGVRDPSRPERRIAEFTLRDEALSTSGDGTQFFVHDGQRFGHVIDPRTGWPAQGLLSATVIAPTAAEADALSTAAFLLGPEGTQRLCDRRPDVSALLLAPPERAGEAGPVTHAFNLAGRAD